MRERKHIVHSPSTRVEDVVQRLDENGSLLELGVVGEVRLYTSLRDITAVQRLLQRGSP
jgi:hypothetical protein